MHKETAQQIENLTRELGRINAMYSTWAARLDADYSQVRVLMALKVLGPQTQQRIAAEHAMPKQSVNNIVRTLKQQGFVELKPSETDGREKNVHLTATGANYAQELLAPFFAIDAQIIEHLGVDRYTHFLEALTAYADALTHVIEHPCELKTEPKTE